MLYAHQVWVQRFSSVGLHYLSTQKPQVMIRGFGTTKASTSGSDF